MTSLEPKQKAQLEAWIDEVREHEHSALKWAALLYKIKESGYWQTVAKSWPDFCHDVFGYSRDKAYRYVACGEALQDNKEEFTKDPPKSIRQVKLRSVARLQHTNLEYVGTEIESKEKPMSARLIPDAGIDFAKPQPPPAAMPKMVVAVPVWNEFHSILRYANQLQNLPGSAFSGEQFRKLVGMLKVFESHIQMNLPGIMEQVPSEAKKAHGTFDEVRAYITSDDIGLPESDAVYIFNKWDGSGWQNGRQKIRDWKATVRSWKAAGYFPSQKVQRNGSPDKPKHWAAKELDRDLETLRREK